jgi:hypothetical protein
LVAGEALVNQGGDDVDQGARPAEAAGPGADEAAFAGDVELITALLAGSADPDVVDDQFGTPPLVWAGYACQPAAVEMLEPVTGR